MRNKNKKHDYKNLLYFIFTLGISLIIAKYYKRQPTNKASESGNVLDNLGVKPSDMPRLIDIATNVANDMGTAYPKWDPRNWTENDRKVYEQMLRIQTQYEFTAVAQLYSSVHAKGHDLSTDLKKNLDSQYYEKLIYK